MADGMPVVGRPGNACRVGVESKVMSRVSMTSAARAWLTAAIKPALARQARAALAMDTLDMTFDPTPTRRAVPGLPDTGMQSAIKELLA